MNYLSFFCIRILAAVLFFINYSIASSNTIKETEKALSGELPDTTRLNYLLELSESLRDFSPVRALPYALEAASLADSLNNSRGLIRAYNDLGVIYENIGNIDKSRKFYSKALMRTILNDDKYYMSAVYNNIGGMYLLSGQFDSAVIHYTKSLQLKSFLNDKNGMASTYSNLGSVQLYRKEYDQAMKYYRESLKIRLELDDKKGIVNCMINIAGVLIEQGEVEKALGYYQQGLKIREKEGDNIGIAQLYNGIAKAYYYMDDYKTALKYQQKELAIVNAYSGTQDQAIAYNNIAATYNELGDYDNALSHYQASLAKATESQARHIRSICYLNMVEVYEAKKDFQNALKYQKLYQSVNDSMLGEKRTEQIAEMQVRFETQQKEQENTLLKNNLIIEKLESKGNRNMVYSFGTVSLLILVSTGFLFYRQKEKRKVEVLARVQKDLLMQQKITELELQALRSQINPHFVFNCLSSIQNLIDKGDTVSADHYLGNFAKLMRMVLEFSRTENISLNNEIEYLHIYLNLELMRFDNRFTYEINVDNDIIPEEISIPPMIIQPIVENAIKHGLSGKSKEGMLTVLFRKNHESFICIVEDNGIGRKKSSLINRERSGHTSMGMNITKERLSLQGINDAVNIIDLYDASNDPAGTKVEIIIPFN